MSLSLGVYYASPSAATRKCSGPGPHCIFQLEPNTYRFTGLYSVR